jgi:predicted transcriptional regulator
MAEVWNEVMGRHPQLMLTLNSGEAIGTWLRREHPRETIKAIANNAGIDRRTAENILQGHLSAVTFTKLVRAYGWRFMAAVGAEMIGETYEQYLHRELEDIAHERRGLEEREGRLRDSWARLRARGAVDGGVLRLVHPEDADSAGEVGRTG